VSEERRFARSAVRTRSQRVAWSVLLIGGWKFFALLVKRERIIKYGWASNVARSAGSESRVNKRERGSDGNGGVPEHGFYFCTGVDFGVVDSSDRVVYPRSLFLA